MNPLPRTFVTRDGRQLTIDLAQIEGFQEVCDFLGHHLFEMSPNCYLAQNNPIEDIGMWEFISNCLRNPVSLTVRDSSGRLVAVTLSSLDEISDRHKPLCLSNNELVVSLLVSLQKDIDLFTSYKTNKIFGLQMMAVDKHYSRLGLGSMLVKTSIDLAKKHDAGAVAVWAVSEVFAKLADTNGLETLRTIDYATFELNGAKPLANEAKLLVEHRVAKFMARSIP